MQKFWFIIFCFNVGTGEISKEAIALCDEVNKHLIFKLYTRQQNDTGVDITRMRNLTNTTFDPKNSVKILVHGFIENSHGKFCEILKRSYLKASDLNVIVVDWGYWALGSAYKNCVKASPTMGKRIGHFVENLRRVHGIDLENVHLIGYSLGAHIAGYASTVFKKRKLGRITGLDPALPSFLIGSTNGLNKDQAKFVDVIHTCGPPLAISKPIGHADFYPNGGLYSQPGCARGVFGMMCSHTRSWVLFAESIATDSFLAAKCDSYYQFRYGKCLEGTIMGEYVEDDADGLYFLNTAKEYPYSLGRPGALNE